MSGAAPAVIKNISLLSVRVIISRHKKQTVLLHPAAGR